MVRGTPTAAKKMLNSLQMSHFRKTARARSDFSILRFKMNEGGGGL